MSKFKGTIYSRYTVTGQDNPDWNWVSMGEMLSAFLGDPLQSKADRDYAATILSWAVEKDKVNPEMRFWTDADLDALWEWPARWALQDVIRNGVTHRECVCAEPLNVMPASAGVQSATPQGAVPELTEEESEI